MSLSWALCTSCDPKYEVTRETRERREAASCKQVLKRTLDSSRKACDGQTRSINVQRRGPEDLLERSKKILGPREEKGQRPNGQSTLVLRKLFL